MEKANNVRLKQLGRILILMIWMMVLLSAIVWGEVRPADVEKPADGNVFINVDGRFRPTTKDDILKRINEIREEAYNEGFLCDVWNRGRSI